MFKALAEALCSLFHDAGIKVRPYIANLPFFSVLPTERKSEILKHFGFYLDLCTAQLQEGQSLRDSQTFTWRALKACGLTPGSDFLQRITPGDVVEIYSTTNNQIFRNLEFFDFCSYTLEELFSREWWNLFSRSETVTNNIMNIASSIFAGEHPKGIHYPVLAHTVKEISSPEKFEWNMDIKFLGPLSSNRTIKALFCIEKIQPL